MKQRFGILILLLFVFKLAAFAAQPPKYEVVEHFVVGGEGGWDYVTFDPDSNRLFIPRGRRSKLHIILSAASPGTRSF